MITAARLVPGIQEFPDIEEQLDSRLRSLRSRRKCRGCEYAKLATVFRQRLATRRGVTNGKNNRSIGT